MARTHLSISFYIFVGAVLCASALRAWRLLCCYVIRRDAILVLFPFPLCMLHILWLARTKASRSISPNRLSNSNVNNVVSGAPAEQDSGANHNGGQCETHLAQVLPLPQQDFCQESLGEQSQPAISAFLDV